ncbi:MAG: hypothetical protein HY510_00895 [Acidobacteria bacterium]|nr:hypothetical protein [Acidobacteriota bacterium]
MPCAWRHEGREPGAREEEAARLTDAVLHDPPVPLRADPRFEDLLRCACLPR